MWELKVLPGQEGKEKQARGLKGNREWRGVEERGLSAVRGCH